MTAYDTWLERPFQENEDRLDRLNAMVERLLDTDQFCATHTKTFLNAIDDAVLWGIQNELRFVLQTKTTKGQVDYEGLGRLIMGAVERYVDSEAEVEAMRILEKE